MREGYADWAARWRVPLGFALGVVYLVVCQPALQLLVAGSGVALVGLAIRGYAAGCLEKNQALALGGPYAYTRNPLYLGSLVMGVGFAVAGGSWIVGGLLFGFLALIYWPVMRREEAHLREHFGEAFARYAGAVPFFFPAARPRFRGGDPWRWSRYRRNREYQAALGYVAAVAWLLAKMSLR